MMKAITFGTYKFTKNTDGTIRVDDGIRSGVLPRDKRFSWADLQRLAQNPQARQMMTRFLVTMLPDLIKKT
jgi:hypothetical protein